MADYIFELVIDELDNRGLFLEKAGEKEFTPAIIQDFGECWGVQDSVHERRIFEFWKDSFFSMLLQKYNIDEKDCMVRFQGPKEMHDFFLQEKYKGVFEPVGEPIKRIEDSKLWAMFDDESRKQFSMENETSVIKFFTDKYIPEKKNKLTDLENELSSIEKTLEEKNKELGKIEGELSKIQTSIEEENTKKENNEKSLVRSLETVYRDFSSKMNELCDTEFIAKKKDELEDEVKNFFDTTSVRKGIINNISCEKKDILRSVFTLNSLSDCVKTSINCALVRGKEHGFFKNHKWFEYSFDSSKFINTLNERINITIEKKTVELRSELNLLRPFDEKLDLSESDLRNKKNEKSKCKKQIEELEKKQVGCKRKIDELNKSLTSEQNKLEALNAR